MAVLKMNIGSGTCTCRNACHECSTVQHRRKAYLPDVLQTQNVCSPFPSFVYPPQLTDLQTRNAGWISYLRNSRIPLFASMSYCTTAAVYPFHTYGRNTLQNVLPSTSVPRPGRGGPSALQTAPTTGVRMGIDLQACRQFNITGADDGSNSGQCARRLS